jgi:N-methylhydantoinase A
MTEMLKEAAAVVQAAAPEGNYREARRAYMRYAGQGYEIAVPVPVETLGGRHAAQLREAFDAEYQRLYGRLIPDLDVEILSWTLTLVAREPDAPADLAEPVPRRLDTRRTCRLFDAAGGGLVDAALHLRCELEPGHRGHGPALVVEDQTTTVINADFAFRVDARNYLVLDRVPAVSAAGP